MTEGYLCDRCENFREDMGERSQFETTVEATGARLGKGETSTWDLCPGCATTLVSEYLPTASDKREDDDV